MIGRWWIEGHAIVSADDRIAGPDGLTPPSLRNDADWARFQSALDAAAVTVLGRLAHEANPNAKGRNRLVLSSSARGVERRADAWWWNPAEASPEAALDEAAPAGGTVVVPGGRRVFDLFLAIGYDAFDLARAEAVRIPGGIPIFSSVTGGSTAAAVLAAAGLVADKPQVIDSDARISLTQWLRPNRPRRNA